MTITTSPRRCRARSAAGLTAAVLVGVTAVPGCGSAGGSSSKPVSQKPSSGATVAAPHTSRPASSSYNPKIVPADFTTKIDNPYFSLRPGMVTVAKGFKDGVPQTHTMTVTGRTKMIAGVRTRVVSDIVTTTGGALVEKVGDWYAQDRKGNVWYFGEATADYEKGAVVSTQGSWETGVDGAKPGIVMPAHPKPGRPYYSEFRPGVAEDRAQVLRIGDVVRVPRLGRFKSLVVIRDTNPLDPQLVSIKWFARGVGQVRTVREGSSHKEFSDLVAVRG